MPVNLSIKNVPAHLAERLRQRAVRHHRSLQGELISILEESAATQEKLTPLGLLTEVRSSGLKTHAESVRIIRKERDGRSRR